MSTNRVNAMDAKNLYKEYVMKKKRFIGLCMVAVLVVISISIVSAESIWDPCPNGHTVMTVCLDTWVFDRELYHDINYKGYPKRCYYRLEFNSTDQECYGCGEYLGSIGSHEERYAGHEDISICGGQNYLVCPY